MGLFNELLKSKTYEAYDEAYELLLADDISHQNPNFIRYIRDFYANRPEAWAQAERFEQKLPTHGNNTTNLIEPKF